MEDPYLRTDEELFLQNKGLVEISDILEQNGLMFWLGGGTLLGAIRDKDFIRWDWDVECDLRSEDVEDKIEDLSHIFMTAGFKIWKIDSSFDNLKIVVKKYGAIYELLAWRLDGEFRRRKPYKLPARFFTQPEEIEFRGRRYYALSPPKEVLTWMFGDWKVPKITTPASNSDEYLSDKFLVDRTSRSCLIRLSSRLGSKIRKTIKVGFGYSE